MKLPSEETTEKKKYPTAKQRRLEKAIHHLSVWKKPYTGDFSVIDPGGLGCSIDSDSAGYDGVHILFKKEENEIDRIMTLDIEAFSKYPDIPALICLYDPENPDRKGLVIEEITSLSPDEQLVGIRLLAPYRESDLGNLADYEVTQQWHDQYQYARYQNGKKKGQIKRDHRGELIVERVTPGGIELLENKLLSLDFGKDTPTVRMDCYAHNGKRYDWKGLADEIVSDWEIDPVFESKDKPGCFINPETGEEVRPSKKARYFRDPEIADYMRTQLWASGNDEAAASSLIRRRTVRRHTKTVDGIEETEVEITNGIGETFFLIWTLRPCGGSYFIEVSISREPNKDGGKKHRLRLLDSIDHLTASLKMMGAKGETPKMFTDPIEWMEAEAEAGRVDVKGLSGLEKKEVLMDHWRKCAMSKDNLYYVKQDCKILYDALKGYQETYGDIVRHPMNPAKPVDPLTFLTSAQASLAAMIILSEMSHDDTMGNGYAVAYYPQNDRNVRPKQALKSKSRGLDQINDVEYAVRPIPYFPLDTQSACFGGWYQYGEYCRMMRPASFGGRTEVFQIKTRKGYRKVSIDKNSMYPSMMGDESLFYANPKFLRKLDSHIRGIFKKLDAPLCGRNLLDKMDAPIRGRELLKKMDVKIRGRKAILAHLKKHSGVYRIIVSRATNPVVRDEFPIFPIRISNTDYDNRAVYADWKQPVDIRVTGEELRYFLEMTEVEDDNIEVQVEGTCYSTLIPAKQAPFFHFAKKFYGLRQRSQKEERKWEKREKEALEKGDKAYAQRCNREKNAYKSKSLFAKMQLVSGGFGVLLQMNTEDHLFIEGEDRKNDENFKILMSMSPDWKDWERYTDKGIEVETQVELSKGKIESFGSKEALRFAKEWAVDHYASKDWDNIRREKGGSISGEISRLIIRLPETLSPHAIPAFGIGVTAHARVDLHKAIMTVRNIPSFRVLYCDTDSVHFEVPEKMSDEEVIKHLSKAKVRRGENYESQIKIGNDLGEWKIEPVKVNKDLIDPESEDVDLNNVAALYLAPKLYMIMSQDTGNGHVLYKETVKGIHQYSTPMRVSLLSLFINEAKLGDHRMTTVDSKFAIDLLNGIESGQNLRRIFDVDIEKPSRPIVIQQAKEKPYLKKMRERRAAGIEVSDAEYTWQEYRRDVARETLNQATPYGLRAATNYYLENVMVNGEPIKKLRDSVKEALDNFSEESYFGGVDSRGLIRANSTIDKLGKLTFGKSKATVLSSRDPKDKIAGGFGTSLS